MVNVTSTIISPEMFSGSLAGVDGCKGGWLMVRLGPGGDPAGADWEISPEWAGLETASSTFVAVDMPIGLPDGSDAACLAAGAGSSCATLAGAVAAMGATGAVRVINVYASRASAPFALPPTLVPGLAIRGMPLAGGGMPVVSFTGAALGGNLVSLASSDVVLSNLVLDGSAPCRDGLVRVGRADDLQAGDGAQCGDVLDGLVGGTVLADADGVVREHEHDLGSTQGGQAHRRTHVVEEHEERATGR